MHRPGYELRRITPRTQSLLRSDAVPWVARAQQEHDVLADVLRGLGTEVIYLTGLLVDVLEYSSARTEVIASVLANCELGAELASIVSRHLETLSPEDLATALVGGLTHDELRTGRGLVYDLLEPRDFVIEPLPNLVFTKDASAWLGDQVVIGALRGPRRRETDLLGVVYGHHPRFASLGRSPYRAIRGGLDCGDVLLLGPGVVAVGVGAHSSPASAELLARHLLGSGVADSVLAVPIGHRAPPRPGPWPAHRGSDSQLDRVCTVLDAGVVLMVPALAFTLTALTITASGGELRVSRPHPFLEAAALALNIDRMTVVGTGVDSLSSLRGQWDDGGNALAAGNRTIICDERNADTNARLADEGFDVITVPCGELGGVRGGPRCMCVPLLRDPVAVAENRPAGRDLAELTRRPLARLAPAGIDRAIPAPAESESAERVVNREELAPLR